MSLTTKSISILSATAILASLALAPSAFANEGARLMETVPFSQAELQTTEGVIAVHNRVSDAAEKICNGNRSIRILVSDRSLVNSCVSDLLDQALSPSKYAVLASFDDSLSSSNRSFGQVAQNNWSLEGFKMAQMELNDQRVSNDQATQTTGLLP